MENLNGVEQKNDPFFTFFFIYIYSSIFTLAEWKDTFRVYKASKQELVH